MHESANGLKLTISITDHTVTVKQLWLAPNDSSPSIDGIQLDQFTWSISVPRKYFATQLDQGRVWLDSTLANNYHTKESFRIAVSSKTLITFATNFFSMPAITRVEEY
ncbi:hypothetical protein FD09_GL002614 [Schleiferilactobacillus perolens DSM 12744]|uniref:Uncharacterized protein n=2 Tax=Schleiferilactobacillus perolens TaxID=100468 RepID=A0A0R1MYF4_9LACO|nr:hypothetical protein FD09_GL002614 [Schleiferilactobacillus perolens DSM 12744]